METKYHHTVDVHNLEAPSYIVPLLIDLFNPQSVVDFGCGLGTFLSVFMQNGITDIMGLDGDWVDRHLLEANIPSNLFCAVNLEEDINLGRRYDLAICLEVAEHLPKRYADTLVNNLIKTSDIIVFSAAIPYQGGQNHVNEQWPTYWQDLFEKRGYRMFDIIRNRLWNNPNIFFWYKQNMFVLAKEGSLSESIAKQASLSSTNPIYNIVHPDLYQAKVLAIDDAQKQIITQEKAMEIIITGKRGLRFYLGLLKKYVMRKIKQTK